MNLDKRKILTAAAPLAIGIATLLILNALSGPKRSRDTPSGTSSSDASSPVPQNPAHERAGLEEQLKLNPSHPPILIRLAEMEREAGRPAGAVKYLREALEHDPTNEEARLNLGRALYEAGDIAAALVETKQLLADHPNQVDGLYNLGAIYANQGQIPLARQSWTQAVSIGAGTDSGKRAQDALGQLGK
jgi:tetratricopeptide (TPR) repeat protein